MTGLSAPTGSAPSATRGRSTTILTEVTARPSDIAFRLLDAPAVKQALKAARDPLVLVVSGDIYSSVVRHGYDGIDRGGLPPPR